MAGMGTARGRKATLQGAATNIRRREAKVPGCCQETGPRGTLRVYIMQNFMFPWGRCSIQIGRVRVCVEDARVF